MAKKFSFYGKTLEELQAMPLDDFVRLVPSKQRRTLKRMNHQIRKFLEKFRKHKAKEKTGKQVKPLRTHFREMVVLPEMVGSRIQVYDGKSFVDVNIIPEMLGRRLGEYAITTKMVKHGGPGIGATRGSTAVELK
ncbi:MAG: 30S ribosomal protein S19 [Candidatus Norongarragalinales archaeon]